ncbi:TPA: nucleotidyltransferase domain-containing protein [Candidatus Woesearchaeota archaeon]|nr:nucleotidyltransferase domain-containing protein [Candidatus Woesearchaeota archaeon]
MDNKLLIINYLGKHIQQAFTMHNLSKLIGIPYASFYRTVQNMNDVLDIEVVGKSKTISLHVNNPILRSLLAVTSDEERKEFIKKNLIIKKIATELKVKDIVVLFGSYAKGKETERSDIDLLIINKEGKKSVSFSKYELLFKKKINPLFITPKEFKTMLQDKEENVGKQALEFHVIVNNPEAFWRLVFNGI